MPSATGWRGPSANGSDYLCYVLYLGYVGDDENNSPYRGVRPVVSIPKSDSLMTALGLN